MKPLVKRIGLYIFVLLFIVALVYGYIIYDILHSPYPPDIALEDYQPRSTLVLKNHLISKPKYPVIDFHSHPQQSGMTVDQIVDIMDRAGVKMVVDLEGRWGKTGKQLPQLINRYNLHYPGRFVVFYKFDWNGIGWPNYVNERIERLEKAVKMGIKGIKVWKDLGMTVRDRDGNRVPIDDPRLDPLWEKVGEFGLPVVIHVGDPPSFWDPLDKHNERYQELAASAEYTITGDDLPPLEQLFKERENLIRKHPNTIFVGAHFGSLGWNLPELSRLFDTYPNFYVDISDRLYEVGRQPYTAREFFIKYQDRIFFGIDYIPETQVYLDYYRFFETYDEYFDYPRYYYKHGNWKIYGISLPDSVLKKIYYKNAERLLNNVKFN